MAELLVSAPAKINLHLEVLGLRPDGFHELAMVMQTLDLADQLRLRPTADGRISLSCQRSDLPTDGSNHGIAIGSGPYQMIPHPANAFTSKLIG